MFFMLINYNVSLKIQQTSMKNPFIAPLLILALLASFLTACNDDEEVSASTGVIVRSVLKDGVPAYATVHQVISNSPMDTVIVTDPNGSTYGLYSHHGNPYEFVMEPTADQYSTTAPKAGDYSYKIKFSTGEEKTLPNNIISPYVTPSQQITVTKTTVNSQSVVVLDWNAVPNAEAYGYEVTSGNDLIRHSHHLFTLEPGTNGKITFPIEVFSGYTGQTINFKVVAYDLLDGNTVINSTSWSTVSWVAQ
jgi:hypothetical protein